LFLCSGWVHLAAEHSFWVLSKIFKNIFCGFKKVCHNRGLRRSRRRR